MKYLSTAILSTVGVIAVSFATGSANAASITDTDLTVTEGVLGGTPVDLSTGFGAVNIIVPPTLTSTDYANPSGNTSPYLAVEPNNFQDPGVNLTPGLKGGPVLFQFLTSSPAVTALGFQWGSVDLYNSVTVYLSSVSNLLPVIQETITGQDLLTAFGSSNGVTADGNRDASNSPSLIFAATSGYKVDGIQFDATGIAFEVANFTTSTTPTPVPVPAIVPGIALAAAFFGSKSLKRNKKASDSVA